MRKWLIVFLSLVLTALCAVVLVTVAGRYEWEPAAPTQAVQATADLSLLTQTTAAPETTVVTEPTMPAIDPPDMSQSTATHAFVYDATNHWLLYTLGDQTQQIAPASLTKLFTAYVAMQYLDPEAVVTVGEEAGWIAADSSIASVSEGCRLSVGMILQGMMMQSGNDAAYAMAVAAGRAMAGDDTLEAQAAYGRFMEEVNSQLEALGLTGTHFVNPDGYHHDDHYTTPADLLEIAKLAMTQPLIMEYCGTASAVVQFESGEEHTWKNTNWLLHQDSDYYCPEVTGLKTGATSQAGMCMIASFDTGERTLIIGVLGCQELEQRFADTLTLFEHYK